MSSRVSVEDVVIKFCKSLEGSEIFRFFLGGGGADQYTHQTHAKKSKFMPPDTLKQVLPGCLFLDFYVKHFPNYLSLHYEKLFIVNDF